LSAATTASPNLVRTSGRQALRPDDALPRIHVDVLHAGFGHRRHVGQHRRALGSGHRQGPELAALDVLQDGVHVLERRVDLGAEQVGDRRAAALVRNVQSAAAALQPEQLGGEVVAGTVARRGEAHLVGIRLLVGDHVGQRLVRRRGGYDQNIRRLDRHGDRIEILERVVLHALDQVRRDHQRPERGEEKGIAVGRSALHRGGADRARRPGFVVDDEGLAEGLVERRPDRPGDVVGGTAGRKRHDQG
jgi:hypothetical protein